MPKWVAEQNAKKKKKETYKPNTQTGSTPSQSSSVAKQTDTGTGRSNGVEERTKNSTFLGGGSSVRRTEERVNKGPSATKLSEVERRTQKTYGTTKPNLVTPEQNAERRTERRNASETRRTQAQAVKSGEYARRENATEWGRDITDTMEQTLKQIKASDIRMLNQSMQGITRKDAFLYTTEAQRQKADEKVKRTEEKYSKQLDEANEALESIKNKHGYLGQRALEAVSSGTGMAVDLGLGALTGGAGLMHMKIRSTGGTMGQVQKKADALRSRLKDTGYYTDSELDEMFKNVEGMDLLNAELNGDIEAISELFFRGFGPVAKYVGGSSIAEKIGSKLLNKAGGKATGGILKNAAKGTAEEIAEEEMAGPAEAFIANAIYGNKFQGYQEDALKRSLADQSNTLRSQIQSPEDAQMAAARLSSPAFMEESINTYMEAGHSREEAMELAEMSRDYLSAALSGDVDGMKVAQDAMVQKLAGGENDMREKFTLRDAVDAAVSTAMMTLPTGLPGAVSTQMIGNDYKMNAGLDAVKKQAEIIRNWGDEEDSKKAEGIIESIDNGNDMSGTQVYEVIQEAARYAAEGIESDNIKMQTAQKKMADLDLRVAPIDADGNLGPQTQQRYIQGITDTISRYQTLARLSNRSESAEDFVGPSAPLEKRSTGADYNNEDVVLGADIGESFNLGIIEAEQINDLISGSETVKEVFRDVTGIDIEQFDNNRQMRDALMAQAADNLVNSARIEQIAWNDEVKGGVADSLSKGIGGEGDKAVSKILESVDPRDRSHFLLTADVSRSVYDRARNTDESWDDMRWRFKNMYPSVDMKAMKDVYIAAKEDKAKGEAYYGKVVTTGDKATRSSLNSADTAYVAGKFTDKRQNKEGKSLQEESLLKAIASAFGINIDVVDDLSSMQMGKNGKPVLDEEGNPLYRQDNGLYNSDTNTLILNAHPDATRTITQTMAHELTHHIAVHAPEEYVKLQKYIMDAWYRQDANRFNREINRIKALYKAQKNQDLTTEQALEELIADGAADFDWSDEKFIADVTVNEPTLAQKIIDAIKDVLRRIRSILASGDVIDPASTEALYAKAIEFDTVRSMWVKAAQMARNDRAQKAIDEWQDEANRHSVGEPRSASARYEQGYKLTQNQFRSYYSAHKLNLRKQDNIDEQIADIKENGFRSTTALSNVMPVSTNDTIDPDHMNIMQGRYGVREGETVLLVPKNYVDKSDRIKDGFVPRDYEVVTAERDFQPYYELYSKAYDEAHGNVIPLSERFNQESQDIRYSLDNPANANDYAEEQMLEDSDNTVLDLSDDMSIRYSFGPEGTFYEKGFHAKSGANVTGSDVKKKNRGKGNPILESGKEILARTMKKNINAELKKQGISTRSKEAKAIVEARIESVMNFMDAMNDFMEETGLQYTFIGMQDVHNAKISVRKTSDGVQAITMSAMVKNGEYPINFDFTTICKKRQAFNAIIEKLTAESAEGVDISLSPQELGEINNALRKEGLETACLGCFVEARRYNMQNYTNKVCDLWNKCVDEYAASIGVDPADIEDFNFSNGEETTEEKFQDAADTFFAYENTSASKKNPEDRFKHIIRSSQKTYMKHLHPADLITSNGIQHIKDMSTKSKDFFGMLKSAYGVAAPKETIKYVPYNSEVALLPENRGKDDNGNTQTMLAYLKSIGGIRMQSFSDYLVANTFDYMQMVADMAARGFPAHAYTKEIAFARVFGMTGIKINLSIMYDVQNLNYWRGIFKNADDERLREIASKYAGLQYFENADDIPEEFKDYDEDGNLILDHGSIMEIDEDGVKGYLTYLVGDENRSQRHWEETFKRVLEETGDEELATEQANEYRKWIQSINFKEAKELQNKKGYGANCGMIGVGLSDANILLMLNDDNMPYIIPYHASGLPDVIKQHTGLNFATNYEDTQNTRIFVSFTKDGEELGYDYVRDLKNELGSWQKAWEKVSEEIRNGDIVANGRTPRAKTETEPAEVNKDGNPYVLHGTADFDFYGKLENGATPQEAAEMYLDYCDEYGLLPVFPQFAGHPNYYKLLVDYSVTDLSNKKATSPQGTVKNIYPGSDGTIANIDEGSTDYEGIKGILEDEFIKLDEKNKHRDEVVEKIVNEWERHSISAEMDAAYMDAVNSGNMEEAQRLVDEAASMSMANSKIRTKDGKLRRIYHGTRSEDFTTFDMDMLGSGSGDTGFFGRGFYFAYGEGEARYYGPNIINAYVNITNPFNFTKEIYTYKGQTTDGFQAARAVAILNFVDKMPDVVKGKTVEAIEWDEGMYEGNLKTISFEEFAKEYKDVIDNVKFNIDEYIDSYGNKEWIVTAGPYTRTYDWGDEVVSYQDYKYNKTFIDEQSARDKLLLAFEYLNEVKYGGTLDIPSPHVVVMESNFTEEVKRRGYDGVIQSEEGDEVVAFEPSQIKSADTVTYADDGSIIPLSERFDPNNNDIRYSLPTTDADGNVLTDGQMEYFKNSQARDENGRLVPVYHVTRTAGFTVFDPTRAFDGTSISFTNDLDFALNYSSEDESLEDWRTAYENRYGMEEIESDLDNEVIGHYKVYLNMTNPLVLEGDYLDEMDIYEWPVYAKANGYDGVIYKDFENDGSDIYQVFSSNQIKDTRNENPTENPDIRFSIADDNNVMTVMQNKAQTTDDLWSNDPDIAEGRVRYSMSKKDYINGVTNEWNPAWKTEGHVLKESAVKKDIKELITSAMQNSNTKAKYRQKLVDETLLVAREAFDKMQSDEWGEAADMLYDHAVHMVENLEFSFGNEEASEFERYKEMRDYLRETKIYVPENDRSNLDWSAYRSDNFGSILLGDEGIKPDKVWDDLHDRWPEYFSEDNKGDAQSIMEALEAAVKASKPITQAYSSEYCMDLAADLAADLYYIVRDAEAWKSLADRYDEKTKAMKQRHAEAMIKVKENHRQAIKDLKAEMKAHERTKLAEQKERLTDKYESRIESLKESQGEKLAEQREDLKDRYERKIEDLKTKQGLKLREQRRKADFEIATLKQNREYNIQRLKAEKERAVKEEKEKRRQSDAEKRYNRAHRELYNRVLNEYKTLTDMLLKPSYKDRTKNIPEQLRQPVAEMLAVFDLEKERSKQLEEKYRIPTRKQLDFRQLKDALEKVAKEEGQSTEFETYFNYISEKITDIADKMDKMDTHTIDALGNEDIETIRDMLAGLIESVKNWHQLEIDGQSYQAQQQCDKVGEGAKEHTELYGEAKQYGSLRGFLDNIVNMGELTPIYFFRQLKGMYDMYRQIRKGFDSYVMNEQMIIDRIADILSPYYKTNRKGQRVQGSDIEEWRHSESAETFDLTYGPITLTTAQKMSLYCLAKREQAKGHMYADNGGVVASEITAGSKIHKAEEAWKGKTIEYKQLQLTPADVDEICTTLTPEQMHIADELQKLMSDDMSELGNKTSMRMLGIRIYKEKEYFPIKIQGESKGKDLDNIGVKEKVRNPGFSNPLKDNASNPIIIDDIFTVVAKHCNEMNLYASYAVPLTNFMKVYNGSVMDEKSGKPIKIQTLIKQTYGEKAIQYIDNFLDDINGNSFRRAGGLGDVLDKAMGQAKKAAVFANLRVALQQPTAIVRALAVMDMKYFKGVKPSSKETQEMWEHCPIALWKSWGYYDTHFGRDIEDVMMGKEISSRMDRYMSDIYGALDNMTWGMIWQAVKNEITATRKDLEAGSPEFFEACAERASFVFDSTQVVDSPFHRSNDMRDKNGFVKQMTSFMAEPTLSFNVLRQGIVDVVEATKKGDSRKARKVAGRIFAVWVGQALTVAMAQSLVDALRRKGHKDADDDEDEALAWYEEIMKYFTMNFSQNFIDDVMPYNNIYWVKDFVPGLINALKGEYVYGQSNLVYQWYDQITKGIQAVKKKMEKGEAYKKSWYDCMTELFGGLGYGLGFPAKTVMRGVKNAFYWFNKITGADVFADDGTVHTQSILDSLAQRMGYRKKDSGSFSETSSEQSSEETKASEPKSADAKAIKKIVKAGIKEISEPVPKTEQQMLREIEEKTVGYYGADRDARIWDIVGDGYTEYIANGDYEQLNTIRRVIEKAGGNVTAFDNKVLSASKTAYKKTMVDDPTDDQMMAQMNIRNYLLENGMTEAEISAEIVYKSETARDLKAAFRMGNEDYIVDELVTLLRAGITREDIYKLYKYRNYGAKDYSGKYSAPEYRKSQGSYIWPTQGTITSGYGSRSAPTAGASSYHEAIDIGAPQGTPVVAADGGVIVEAGANGGYGNSVGIRHDDGTISYYNHLYSWNVKVGDTVAQGQQIGQVGSTGISTGPHLDFRLYKNGEYLDPEKYLQG